MGKDRSGAMSGHQSDGSDDGTERARAERTAAQLEAERACATPTPREAVFAAVMADRADWDRVTRRQWQLAVAAGAELRRRHPGRSHPPPRSADPEPATGALRDQLSLSVGETVSDMGEWIRELADQRGEFADRLAGRQSIMVPAEDPDHDDLGPDFPC
jgi:hypothetical protein